MTGSLQQKNGKYYAVINLYKNGKRKPKWISTDLEIRGNKKKAEQFLRKKLKEYELQEALIHTDMLFSDYVLYWLNSIEKSVDIITYKGYYSVATAHIIPYFENKGIKLVDVTRSDIQVYIDEKSKNGRLDGKGGLSPKTMRTHKLIINLVCKEALKSDLILKNPCDFVNLPKKARREPTFYSIEQVKILFNSIKNEPLYPLVYLTTIYGLRRSEVLGLRWCSVDFENGKILINHTVVDYNGIVRKDTTKTLSSYRSYPIPDEVKAILTKLKQNEETNKKLFGSGYNKNDYIFKWDNGEPYKPDYVSKKFSKLLKQYNLPHIRFHDLRHSCASLLISLDFTLKDIQEWLGHSDIGITANIYAHLDNKQKNKIANSMSNQFKF